MTALPAFTWEEKRLRKAALEFIGRLEEERGRFESRPLGSSTDGAARRWEQRLDDETLLAEHALHSTNRGTPLDAPWPAEARERVRSCVRLVRAYRQRQDADNERFYLDRLKKARRFYRGSIAHARREMATTTLQAAE